MQYDNHMETAAWERVKDLAESCMEASKKTRPELLRLKELYEKKRKEYGLSKAEMDCLIYERMHKKAPSGPNDILCIRYWRTGHHVPINRNVCLAFGQALELSSEGLAWLLNAYLDKSLDIYAETPPENDPVYRARRNRLAELAEIYLTRTALTPLQDTAGNIPRSRKSDLRHLYYTDALQYIHQTDFPVSFRENHIYSIRYDAELQRSLKLSGEIPRKTMLRHLVILGFPFLSLSWLNEQLSFFGYLPLTENHTLTGGEYLDRLLIGLIREYEQLCNKESSQQAGYWFRCCCRELDALFLQKGQRAFRFMYFKSLE